MIWLVIVIVQALMAFLVLKSGKVGDQIVGAVLVWMLLFMGIALN